MRPGSEVDFEAAGHVDRVAPHVVGELPGADYAGDDRAGVDADAHLPARRRTLSVPSSMSRRNVCRRGHRLGAGAALSRSSPATAMYASPIVLIFSTPRADAGLVEAA